MGEFDSEQVAPLEDAVKRYNDVALARARTPARAAIVAGSLLLALAALAAGWPKLGFAVLCLGVETVLAAFIIGGLIRPSPLFLRARDHLLGCRASTWLKLGAGAVLFIVALFLLSLLGIWLAVTIVATALGALLYFGLDRTIDARRRPARDAAEGIARQLRAQAANEEELQHVVCAYAGNDWEELFEELFSFDAKLKARDWWERDQKCPARPRFAAWREPLIEAIDRRLRARREEDEFRARRIQQYETPRAFTAAVPPTVPAPPPPPFPLAPASVPASRAPAPMAPRFPNLADTELRRPPPSSLARLLHQLLMLIMGPLQRAVIGGLLIAGCLLWMWQNGLMAKVPEIQAPEDVGKILRADDAAPLRFAGVPDVVTKWFNGYGAAVAGLLMLIASSLPNWKAAILMPIAAAVAWLGPYFGVPEFPPLTAPQVSMIAGGVIGLLAMVLGQKS